MKIYTEVNYRWDGDQLVIVSEESYEHQGAIAECSGGGGSNHVEESPHAKELSKIAQEKWKLYTEKFLPVENRFMDKVAGTNNQATFDKAAGMAMNEAKMQIAPTINKTKNEMVASGIHPGSGRYQMGVADTRNTAAGAVGSSGMMAGIGKKDQYIQNVENIIGIGQGQSGRATQGMADLAKNSVQQSKDDAFSAWNEKQANREIVGTGAGMGMAYWMDNQKSAV